MEEVSADLLGESLSVVAGTSFGHFQIPLDVPLREHGICSWDSSQTVHKVWVGTLLHIYIEEPELHFADAPIGLYFDYLQVCMAVQREVKNLDVSAILRF